MILLNFAEDIKSLNINSDRVVLTVLGSIPEIAKLPGYSEGIWHFRAEPESDRQNIRSEYGWRNGQYLIALTRDVYERDPNIFSEILAITTFGAKTWDISTTKYQRVSGNIMQVYVPGALRRDGNWYLPTTCESSNGVHIAPQIVSAFFL